MVESYCPEWVHRAGLETSLRSKHYCLPRRGEATPLRGMWGPAESLSAVTQQESKYRTSNVKFMFLPLHHATRESRHTRRKMETLLKTMSKHSRWIWDYSFNIRLWPIFSSPFPYDMMYCISKQYIILNVECHSSITWLHIFNSQP